MGDENENQQKNIISQFHDRNLRNVFFNKDNFEAGANYLIRRIRIAKREIERVFSM